MVQDKETKLWKFFGITSQAFDPGCSWDYGVFVDVTKFQSWIFNYSAIFICSENVKISISKLCDGKADCNDESDERNCGKKILN